MQQETRSLRDGNSVIKHPVHFAQNISGNDTPLRLEELLPSNLRVLLRAQTRVQRANDRFIYQVLFVE